MDKKIISVIAIFAVLIIGAVAVMAASSTETTTFEQAAAGYKITPMATGCGYFCAKCVAVNGGACTSARVCC